MPVGLAVVDHEPLERHDVETRTLAKAGAQKIHTFLDAQKRRLARVLRDRHTKLAVETQRTLNQINVALRRRIEATWKQRVNHRGES